jgi:hypothetical protein
VRQGDWTAAREHASRALAIQPGQPGALASIAAADLNARDFAAAERTLRDLVDSPALDRSDRPSVYCSLGDALDGLDRVDEAFAQYVTGKAAFREEHRWRYEQPGEEDQRAQAERLTAYFEHAPAEDWASPISRSADEPWPAKGLTFLVGFPRSGTTLLENVLASHPEVLALDERITLRDIDEAHLRDPAKLAKLPSEDAARDRATYWDNIRSLRFHPEGKLVVDKMPLYSVRLPVIHKLFPGVKILFALRDPRDVVLSCFRRAFQINAGMYQFVTLEGTARYYDAVMRLVEVYKQKLPLDVYNIRYENVVADLEGESRAICEFLGLEWQDSLLRFQDTARERPIRTPSAAQVRSGLYTTGAGQWRRYAKHLEPVLPILEPWVERLGYEPT